MTEPTPPPVNRAAALALGAVHASVPVYSALVFGAPPVWILSNLLFAAFLLLVALAGGNGKARWAGSALSGAWMTLSLALAVSWYMQGSGFNDAFFYHLEAGSLKAAATSYTIPSFIGLALLVLAFLLPWFVPSKTEGPASRRRAAATLAGAAAVLVLALATSSPAHSWLAYRDAVSQAVDGTAAAPQPRPEAAESDPAPQAETPTSASEPTPPAPGDGPGPGPRETGHPVPAPTAGPKNILLIYAEGLEQTYLERDVFGDVMPRIRELAAQGRHYVNLHQLPGTNWTVAGMVASQCGFPVVVGHHGASNSTLATAREPFPDSECLADILQERGYRTVFMGGADHKFGGKGEFLRTHGYDEVLGFTELRPLLADGSYVKDWGLYDDSLFDLAAERLEQLEAGDDPWLLTLLTVDTHHPRGNPSRSCAPFEGNDDPMSDAIYCSDQLIGDFVQRALAMVDREDTIIAVFSDHLSLRNSLWKTLRDQQAQRRLLFFVLDDGPAQRFDLSGSHFDVAPTLLDLANVAVNQTLGHGISLLDPSVRSRTGKPVYENYWDVPRALASEQTALQTGIRISASDWSLDLAGLELEPNQHGHRFRYGMFMAVLNDDGKVQDTIYYDDFGQLLEDYGDRFVVGVSMLQGDPGPLLFAGRLSEDPATLVMRPLTADTVIAPAELDALMRR